MFLVDDISVFVRIVDCKGLSAAGRNLQMTTAVVSNRLARLEARLGAKLLTRTTRTSTLTEEGRVYYEHCKRVLAELRLAEEKILDMSGQPSGTLRISIASGFGRQHVAPMMPGFAAAYPGLRLEVQVCNAPVDIVSEDIDIAICHGELPSSSLIVRRLGEERHLVCAAPAYIARHGFPETPASLAHHSCLRLHTRTGPTKSWPFMDHKGKSITHVLGGALESDCTGTLLDWALAGHGLILDSHTTLTPHIEARRLVPVLTGFSLRREPVIAVMPPRRPQPAKTRAFLDYLLTKLDVAAPAAAPSARPCIAQPETGAMALL